MTDFVTDHSGNEFQSISEMLRFWDCLSWRYEYGKSHGYTIEEILTDRAREYVYDHEGRAFRTVKEMCAFWGVHPQTFTQRFRKGWTLKAH